MIDWIVIAEFPHSWLTDGMTREFVFWENSEAVFGKVMQSSGGPLFWTSRQSGIGDGYGRRLKPSHFAVVVSPFEK